MAVTQIGRTLELSFTLPLRAVSGERLTNPLEIQILRAIAPPGDKLLDGPKLLRPWATLLAGDLARYSEGQKMAFPASLSDQEFAEWRGATFIFAVRSLTRGFLRHPAESELSNTAELTLMDVSGPIENLIPATTEKAIELRWSPPSRSLSGRPVSILSSYRVFKSLTGKPGSFRLLGQTDSPGYRDPEFEFDHTYFYKVRAVFKADGQLAESEDSSPVPITPHDTFPPAVPAGLSGIYAPGAVELIWTANTEPDLAGYNVYRREQGGQSKRVNTELLRTPIFRDHSIEPGHEYFYQITAVDLANNESQRSEEFSIETRGALEPPLSTSPLLS